MSTGRLAVTMRRIASVAAILMIGAPLPARSDTATPGGVSRTTPLSVAPHDDDGTVRLSLPTEEDRAAWLRAGFRLGLGVLYGELRGSGDVPDLSLKGVVIRPGIHLDPQWSVYLPLQYAATSLGGARFAAAVEPTWHITPGIALGLGLGYAGLIGVHPYGIGSDEGPENGLAMLGQSYTIPDATLPLSECNGVGVTAVARLELGYVLGPRLRTHLALEALGQWTGCEENVFSGRDPFTGVRFTLRQWWAHRGASLSWGIEWR